MRGARVRGLVARKFGEYADTMIARTMCRPPDFIIGGRDKPYLLRWYLLGGRWKRTPGERPRWVSRTFLGCRPYLHCFLRSDDDRAHHDHPSLSFSAAMGGGGTEHTIAKGGIHRRRPIRRGTIRFRTARFAHRIEIEPGSMLITLFIFLPNIREWGFHCKHGWVHWKEFTASDDSGAIGRGCGEGMEGEDAHVS